MKTLEQSDVDEQMKNLDYWLMLTQKQLMLLYQYELLQKMMLSPRTKENMIDCKKCKESIIFQVKDQNLEYRQFLIRGAGYS